MIVRDFLAKLKFGKLQSFENMAVVALFVPDYEVIDYLTLGEALKRRLIVVTEVDVGGSVPELKVINKADKPVLLLDGEELVGGKQNRTLNTTILLKEKSETVIPVSCTERGRWHYVSDKFTETVASSAFSIRATMARSVAESLRERSKFDADQSEVWDNIEAMFCSTGEDSPTEALEDLYQAKSATLSDYLKAFKRRARQVGLLVFINGEVVGFDVIPREAAYKQLHPKLVRSYALDAVVRRRNKDSKPAMEAAEAFLESAMKCGARRYKSIGYGWDYRLEGEGTVGSALVHKRMVIHTAFFRCEDGEKSGGMAGPSRRRRFRTGWLIE
nr:hypothetical protein [Bacillota bacterium]